MRQFTDKVAVVTGAASGIGRALARELAAKGARLALSDVNFDGVVETVERCKPAAATVLPYQVDVADWTAMLTHADEVAAEFDGSISSSTMPAWRCPRT